jgi:hypothetical protein
MTSLQYGRLPSALAFGRYRSWDGGPLSSKSQVQILLRNHIYRVG